MLGRKQGNRKPKKESIGRRHAPRIYALMASSPKEKKKDNRPAGRDVVGHSLKWCVCACVCVAGGCPKGQILHFESILNHFESMPNHFERF